MEDISDDKGLWLKSGAIVYRVNEKWGLSRSTIFVEFIRSLGSLPGSCQPFWLEIVSHSGWKL